MEHNEDEQEQETCDNCNLPTEDGECLLCQGSFIRMVQEWTGKSGVENPLSAV